MIEDCLSITRDCEPGIICCRVSGPETLGTGLTAVLEEWFACDIACDIPALGPARLLIAMSSVICCCVSWRGGFAFGGDDLP